MDIYDFAGKKHHDCHGIFKNGARATGFTTCDCHEQPVMRAYLGLTSWTAD